MTKNYTRKDTRTLEQVAKDVEVMRTRVRKMVTTHGRKVQTWTIIYKLIGSSEEVSYDTRCSFATLEDRMQENGSKGNISYYYYGTKGTARADMQLMAFI